MTADNRMGFALEQARTVVDVIFGFRNRFDGSLGEVAHALQMAPDRSQIDATDASVAAAAQAIEQVNAAIRAAWPEVPSDLLLRGSHGAGSGRLTVREFKNIAIPGASGALTVEKLAARMTGADARPARRALRLNQVTVPVSNLSRSIEFYRGLGLRLIVRDDGSGYARLLLPDGEATFSLHVADGAISRSDVVIYFECDDLDDRAAQLCAAGYRFSSMPVDQTWLWREAMLEDPDGQRICLYHAGVNRKNPPWRLVDSITER